MDWTYTIGSFTFGLLDIITLVIILIGAVSGCIAGFARQVANLVGIVVSIPVGLLFTKPIAMVLANNTGLSPLVSSLIVFVSLCVVAFIVVAIFGSMLKRVLETVPALDKILGFAWGLVSSAAMISIILMILNFQSFVDISSFTSSSIIITRFIEPLFPTFLDVVTGQA